MSNENYKGSIELISGLKPKNNGDFPLVEAHSVAFYNEDGTEIRLDEKIEQVGVSEEDRAEIIGEAIERADENLVIAGALTNMDKNSSDVSELKETVKGINNRLTIAEEGDNDKLRITYNENVSTLYLHTGEEVAEDASNVISQTIVKGGGGGTAASYKLILQQDDVNTSSSILKGDAAVINFTPLLTSLEDNSPVNNEKITLYVYINDALKITTTQKSNEKNSIDVSNLLKVGFNNVKVTASYSEVILDTGDIVTSRSTKSWSFDVIEMYLTSEFSDATVKTVSAIGDKITYTFTPYGALQKTVYFKLDGKVISTMNLQSSDTDRTKSIEIAAPGHGAYDFEVWCTGSINGKTVESEHLYYNIMFAVAGDNTPIVRMKADSSTGQQYSTSIIKYTVYKADSVDNTIHLAINGEITNEVTVDRKEQIWTYKPLDFGDKKLSILFNGIEYNYVNLKIEKFPYEISPITANLAFDFNPTGRTNQDSDYNKLYDENGESLWDLEDNNNFDWVNGGWQRDNNGNTYFCIKAGTFVTFKHKMFEAQDIILGADGARGTGREFKLVFKTTNVANSNATFLECQALPAVGSKEVGLEMKVHHGYVKSNNNTLEIPYSEEDIIEFDVNINPARLENNTIVTTDSIVPMVLSYEDGAPFLPMTYTDAETSFTQVEPADIKVGSLDCDVHIYRMKCYHSALTSEDILNNFIADGKNGEEISTRFLRNQIFVNGALTPEGLAEACPDLKIIKISCPYFTNDKNNFVENTSMEMIHINGDPALDNWTFSNGFHSGQGTSSNEYGFAGRNIDLLMCFDGEYKHKKILKMYEGREDEYWAIRTKFESKDGSIRINDGTGKVGLSRTSVPTSYFNIKVNIASSENANNALLAKRFNRYLPYKSVGQKRDPYVKNTMEFINCAVFLQEYDEDISKHREFQDTDWHFYAIGNIGDSKKTDQTRAYDPDDTKEFVVEILDNNMPNAAFQTGYIDENNPMENKYPIDENLWKEGNEAYDALYADGWDGDNTFEMRYEHPDVSDEQSALNIEKWNEFYKWVITVSDDTFKKDLKKWVNLPAAYYYYLFTERYTMMDNRAKNSFWHWSKLYITQAEVDMAAKLLKEKQDIMNSLNEEATEEEKTNAQNAVNEAQELVTKLSWFTIDDEQANVNEGYRFDWWDYDNDTSLGIDNSGTLRMPYGKEDIDTEIKDGFTVYYFNAANSVFYRRLKKLFPDELKVFYSSLEESQCFNANSLINEFDSWQGEFPEALWIQDFERKYLRTYRGENGKKEPDHLNLRMTGRKKYHRRQWERDQEGYMSSKYISGSAIDNKILMRAKTPSGVVVPPKFDIDLIPYKDMYLNVQFGPNKTITKRALAGNSYNLNSGLTDLTDNQISIFNGKGIQSIGDISAFYISEGTFSPGEKLKTLIVGNKTEGYANPYVNTKSFNISDANKLLEYLDIRNLTALTEVELNLPNLKYFYAQGSGLTSASFANNGLLQEAYLPASVSTVIMNNLYYLRTLEFEGYNSLNKLIISNCPNINELEIVENAENLRIVRLTNIDWVLDNATVLNRLLKCSGVQADGNTPVDQSVLTGKVVIKTLRQSELNAFKEAWKDLEIICDGEITPDRNLYFYNDEGEEIYHFQVGNGHILSEEDNPKDLPEVAEKLLKDSTAEFTFSFIDWDDEWRNSLGERVFTDKFFHAVYEKTRRSYKVCWYDDDANANSARVLTDSKGNKAEITVPYGTEIFTKYDSEIKIGKVVTEEDEDENIIGYSATVSLIMPTKIDPTFYNYYLFNGWNAPTSKIIGETKIYPVWEKSSTEVDSSLSSNELTPVQIKALSSLGEKEEGLLSFIADGEDIKVQLGYLPNVPCYYEPDPAIMPREFNGTEKNIIDTDIKLFDEDKDFTILIDYTNKYSSATNNTTIMSCGGIEGVDRGIQIYSEYNPDSKKHKIPIAQWNVDGSVPVSKKAPIKQKNFKRDCRDIYVIRHKKGDPNLYVYTHNRYSDEGVVLTVLPGASFVEPIQYTVCFGALKSEKGNKSCFATGTLNVAKIWLEDLGDGECRKMCSWTQDTLTFRRCGLKMYSIPGTEKRSLLSFVGDFLLEEPMAFDKKKHFDGGWNVSYLREWLNTKFFSALSPAWQQVIQPVQINSLYGNTDASTTASANKKRVTSVDKLYIPSAAELSKTKKEDAVYGLEKSPSNEIYSNFIEVNTETGTTKEDFNRTFLNGQPWFWWTRTPNKSYESRQLCFDFTKDSLDGYDCYVSNFFDENIPDISSNGTNLSNHFNKYRASEYEVLSGVLLAFSIGEVSL